MAVDFARGVDDIELDIAADELWCDVYPTLSGGRAGMFGAVTARAAPQVIRLACISALINLSSIVRSEHLQAALALWRYCEDSARYIWGDSTGHSDADRILRELRQHSAGRTRTSIRDLFQRNRTESEISRALAVLEEHRLARSEKEGDTGGRDTERWFATESRTTKTT